MWGGVGGLGGAGHIVLLDGQDQALARAREWIARRKLDHRASVIDARKDPVEAVVAETRGGVDVALEISGHPTGINNALRMTRAAGHVVHLGLPKAESVAIEKFS